MVFAGIDIAPASVYKTFFLSSIPQASSGSPLGPRARVTLMQILDFWHILVILRRKFTTPPVEGGY